MVDTPTVEAPTVEQTKGLKDFLLGAIGSAVSADGAVDAKKVSGNVVDYLTDPNNKKGINTVSQIASYMAASTGNKTLKAAVDMGQGVLRADLKDFQANGITKKNAGPIVHGLVDTGLNNALMRGMEKLGLQGAMAGLAAEFLSEKLGSLSSNIVTSFGLTPAEKAAAAPTAEDVAHEKVDALKKEMAELKAQLKGKEPSTEAAKAETLKQEVETPTTEKPKEPETTMADALEQMADAQKNELTNDELAAELKDIEGVTLSSEEVQEEKIIEFNGKTVSVAASLLTNSVDTSEIDTDAKHAVDGEIGYGKDSARELN